MKKVLFTATVDSHILQFHLPFLKLFKENGYEVHVATNGKEDIPYCDYKHTIPFERSPFKLNNIKAIIQLKKIIDTEKFNIIHTHTPMGSVVTRLAAKNARKKYHTRVIYTAHGLHFFKGAPLKNWLLFYPVEKYLSKYTDTLILINQEDFDLCKRKFKKCKDIQYVPGVGIDESKFNFTMSDNEKVNLRNSLGLKKSDFVMIYAAELSKRKRQIWLINSIKDLLYVHDDIHLLLPGKDSLNGKCQKLVNELKLENQIHFLGYRSDIPKLLKISNLALSSANQEGLPVNILEALYVGLPVVATNCRGNRDLIKNGVNGYLTGIDDFNKYNFFIKKLYISKEKNYKINVEKRYFLQRYLLDEVLIKLKKIYFKRKKILHVLASNIYSGAEKVASTIIENLKDEYDLYYCSPKGKIADVLKEKNINYIPIDNLNLKNMKKIFDKINPDIVHAHDYKASLICSLIKHNTYLIEHLHNNPPWLKKISVYSFAFLYSSLKSDIILTVSDSIENEYVFSNFIYKKINCIGNPVSVNHILKNIKEKKYEKKYDVCCVARITKQKNPNKLINIINDLKKDYPNIKAIWIGDGELKEEISKKIKKLNLETNIYLLGFKKNPYKYMAQSKIFLLTSDWEGYGLVTFEALTVGLPCVVSNVGGLKNIVNDSCGMLCNNYDDYLDSIKKMMSNSKLLNKLSKNSFKRAKELDNIDSYIMTIKKIYNSSGEFL